MCRKFVENAPLNSKGTTSDWKNIKDYMRESEHFIIAQRDGTQIIFFSFWLTSKKISKRKMAVQCKANTKERKKNQKGTQCWYHLHTINVSFSIIDCLAWENEII